MMMGEGALSMVGFRLGLQVALMVVVLSGFDGGFTSKSCYFVRVPMLVAVALLGCDLNRWVCGARFVLCGGLQVALGCGKWGKWHGVKGNAKWACKTIGVCGLGRAVLGGMVCLWCGCRLLLGLGMAT